MAIKKLILRLVERIWKIYCYYAPKTFTSLLKIIFTNDGVAMGSPLGPVLLGIVMVHLERTLISELDKLMKSWKIYADDTIIYIKPGFITDVIIIWINFTKILNSHTK